LTLGIGGGDTTCRLPDLPEAAPTDAVRKQHDLLDIGAYRVRRGQVVPSGIDWFRSVDRNLLAYGPYAGLLHSDRRPSLLGGNVGSMHPNGVEVRGLRVLRSNEYRRISWWRSAVDVLLGGVPESEDEWSVLTVLSGPGDVVARRRFTRRRDAEDARARFVALVNEMSDDDHAGANWQAVLDRS
jgi:hypothetical protein